MCLMTSIMVRYGVEDYQGFQRGHGRLDLRFGEPANCRPVGPDNRPKSLADCQRLIEELSMRILLLMLSPRLPRSERIGSWLEGKFEFRVMSQDYLFHPGFGDPFQTSSCVKLLRVIFGEKAVAFQATGCHQNEDTERRVAESEALWHLLEEHAHHGIYSFQISVDTLQLAGEVRTAASHLIPCLRYGHAELPAELAKTWHAPLTVADDVHGCEVHFLNASLGWALRLVL